MENDPATGRPRDESARTGVSSAARLLERLRQDGSVDLARVAGVAQIDPGALEACRTGRVRLDPVLQMRLAAAVVSQCPSLGRVAHALYAQAQAELRFQAGDVVTHSTYPYSPLATGRSERERVRQGSTLSDARALRERSADATEVSRRLCERRQELVETAQRLVRESSGLRSASRALLEARVVNFARALRQSGEPMDSALVLLVSALDPLFADRAVGRDDLRAHLERWVLAAYDAA